MLRTHPKNIRARVDSNIRKSGATYAHVLGIASLIGTLAITVFAVSEPWITQDGYNPDLLVLARYIATALPDSAFDTLKDNTLVIYIAVKMLPWVRPLILVNALQNLAALLLAKVLLKRIGPAPTLAILGFCFFTVLLNQFRLGMAIAVCTMALCTPLDRRYTRWGLLLVGAALHLFGGIWFGLLLVADHYASSRLVRRIALATLLVVGVSLVVLTWRGLRETRFYSYIVFDNQAPSFTFILSACGLSIAWRSLRVASRAVLVVSLIVAAITYYLPALSGRIGELAYISAIILAFRVPVQTTVAAKFSQRWQITALLGVSLAFFCYRLIRWMFMGRMDIPVELFS